MRPTQRFTTIAAVALALAVPATAAGQQDLRSPDARDSATLSAPVRDVPVQDLRGPDARDAAVNRVVAARPPAVQVVHSASDRFRWGDAGLGAAGMLGIVLALGGIGILAGHRRTGARMPFAH